MKHGLDRIAAAAALVVLAPILIIVAAAIWAADGRPVLFRQDRLGLRGRPFVLYKFRTMHQGGATLPPGPGRITRIGRVLRLSGLDEVPQLVNVLRGEMSLVGPRPLLPRYLPYFTPDERLRFSVRPGLTGLAQVELRNQANWDERLQLDVRYIRGWSLGADCRILWRTVAVLLRGRNARLDEEAELPPLDTVRSALANREDR